MKNPSNHYALNQLANAYRTNQQYEEAIKVFEELLETPEYRTDVLYFLADAHFHLGEYDQGLSYFQKGINSSFNNLYNSGFQALARFRSAP